MAVNLRYQTLEIDPENSQTNHQLAGAYTTMEQLDEALRFLIEAISSWDSYLDDIAKTQRYNLSSTMRYAKN